MAEKMNSESVIEQANSVLKMLDDLADSDPEAYKKFMSKTLTEGSEQFKPPQPSFCISTVTLPEVITHKLYVNVCGWNQVPAPKTDQDPIPVIAGAVEEITVDDTSHSVVDVIFNTKVLKDIEHKKDHRNLLVHLALDYLEEVKNIQISRKYKALKTSYKGNSSNLTKYLKPNAFQPKNSTTGSTSGSSNTTGAKDTLLEQLSSIAVSENIDKDTEGISLFGSESKHHKKGLIEEISSVVHTPTKTAVKVPKYEMVIKKHGESDEVVVTVELVDVSSVNQCELDVSEVDILLNVPSLYKLQVDLPRKVDDSQVIASFNKTRKVLIIKLPIIE